MGIPLEYIDEMDQREFSDWFSAYMAFDVDREMGAINIATHGIRPNKRDSENRKKYWNRLKLRKEAHLRLNHESNPVIQAKIKATKQKVKEEYERARLMAEQKKKEVKPVPEKVPEQKPKRKIEANVIKKNGGTNK